MEGLHFLDWILIGAYFAVLFGIAWWVLKQKQDTSTEYFLAGRHVGWFVIGAALFASNIGSEHIVGLAGTAAKCSADAVQDVIAAHRWGFKSLYPPQRRRGRRESRTQSS